MRVGEKVRIRKLTDTEFEKIRNLYPMYDVSMKKFYGKVFKIRAMNKANDSPDYIVSLDNDYSYLSSWLESLTKPVTKADFLKALK